MEICVLLASYKVKKKNCTFCNWLYNQAHLLFCISIYSYLFKTYLHFAKILGNGVDMVNMFENRKRTGCLTAKRGARAQIGNPN